MCPWMIVSEIKNRNNIKIIQKAIDKCGNMCIIVTVKRTQLLIYGTMEDNKMALFKMSMCKGIEKALTACQMAFGCLVERRGNTAPRLSWHSAPRTPRLSRIHWKMSDRIIRDFGI